MKNDNKQQRARIGFQEKGADQIFKKLFDSTNDKRRFLLADEVGLGKTITASNVIDRMLENNPDGVTRIGYICNNLSLAKENSLKLINKVKNAKPRIIEGDRLSTFLLDYYSLSDNKNKFIFKGLSDCFKKGDNRMLQYIYLLAPINDSELFFQYYDVNKYPNTNNWSNALKKYSGQKEKETTSQTFFNHTFCGVLSKLKEYFQKNSEEIKLFCEAVNSTWKKQREKYVNDIRHFNGNVIEEFPVKDPVTMKLLHEIVTIWNGNDRKCNAPSYKKDTEKTGDKKLRDFLEKSYLNEYMMCIQEQIEKTNLEIYSITPKTSLGTDKASETKGKKNGTVDERKLVYWLTPVRIDKNGITLIMDLYDVKSIKIKKYCCKNTLVLKDDYENDTTIKDICDKLKEAYLTRVKNKEEKIRKLFDVSDFELMKESSIREDFCEYIKEHEKIQAKIKKPAFDINWMNYMRGVLGRFAVQKLNISLLIADEIQNFSEVISPTKNNSETDALATASKIFENKNIPVLMMSATPFPIYSKKMEKEDVNELVYEESLFGNESIINNSFLSNTDVYKEFLKIVKYLLPEEKWNNWENGKSWKDTWEDYETIKRAAVENWKNNKDNENFFKYVDSVKKQEEMLRAANIVRTERLSVQDGTVFKNENENVSVDSVLAEEILRFPQGKNIIKSYYDIIQDYDAEFYFLWLKTDEGDAEFCTFIKDNKKFVKFEFSDYRNIENYIEDTLEFDELNINENELYKAKLYLDGNIYFIYSIEPESNTLNFPEYIKDSKKNMLQGLGYHKSTPAVFSFSKGYKLYTDALENNQILNHTINIDRIRQYKKLFADGNEKTDNEKEGLLYNARVKQLIKTIFDDEQQHKLLFIPPVHASQGLSGVFGDKEGVSKRLFFSSNRMTTRSLSAILSYEAERRQINDWEEIYRRWPWLETNKKSDNDYQFGVPIIDGHKIKLVWNSKERRFLFWNFDTKKEETATSAVVKILFDYDVRKITDKNNGSPYAYTEKRKDIFPKSENSNPGEAENFCKHYFRYMTSQYSLRVLMAYVYSDSRKADGYRKYPRCNSLYDLIIAYGASGCIHDVFDEYAYASEYSSRKAEDGFAKQALTVFRSPYGVECKGVVSSEDKNTIWTHFAIQHNADLNGNREDEALPLKIKRFNSPFLPFQFISTSIGQEGFDFHLYCRKLVHWNLTHDPVKFEQREGRINRYHCYANRLRAEGLRDSSAEWHGWEALFSELRAAYHDDTGLVPDFVTPKPENDREYYEFVREFYYYPESYEAETLKDVLKSLGSYRALLGRYGDDNYEDDFDAFAEAYSKIEGAKISDLFVDISPGSDKRRTIAEPQPEEAPVSEAPAEPQPEETSAPEVPAEPRPVRITGTVKDPDAVSFAEWYGNDIRANVIGGKKLIVGQSSNGKTLLLREAAKRNGLAGIEAVTITETAMPIVAECLAGSIDLDSLRNICLEPISHNMAVCIMLDIIRRKYRDMENILTYSTAEEIFRTVNMLRMNDLKECKKISGFNIGEILTEYESVLQTEGLYDKARLLQEAIHYLEELHGSEKRCAEELHGYAFLDDHTPDILETKLINLLTNNNVRTVSEGGTTLKDVRFFKTYGMMDEVLTIAKEIQSENLVSGDTAIYYTDQAYVDMIKCIFGEMNIPVFFKDGSSAEKDSTIRLWLSILEWWKNDCRMEYFENILFNPVVQIPGGVNTDKDDLQESSINKDRKSAILKYISRNIGYLYGRHNMMVLAKRFSDKGTEDAQTKKSPEDMALEFIHDLTEIFRAGSINRQCQMYKPSDFFCTGLMSFTEKYHIPDKDYSGLKRSIEIPIRYISCGFDFDGLYSLLSGQLKSLRISEQYAPDAVTAQRLTGQKTISPAMNTFIIGLSSSLVLKKADESPLISDDEISRLIPDDRAKKYLGAQKNVVISDAVKYLVSCIQNGGTLIVSYPCYDQAELKMRSSSDIFESLYTTYGNQADIPEYNSLSFLDSAEAFSKRDSSALFALEKLGKEDTAGKIINDAFLRVMEEFGIKNNTKTESKSAGADQMLKLRLSASSFDTLLNCPRKYYIENIFGIREEPEQKAGSGWLKPNQKGNIFHNVMEEYIGSFCGEEEKLSERDPKEKFRFDKERFEKIFESVISKYDVIPYDIPADKEQEITEIKDTAKKYLDELAAVQNDGYAPCAVEYKFKTGQKTEDLSDSEDGNVFTDQIVGFELEYTIGFLDRVDKKTGSDGKPHFRIVDYKTGSLDNFIEDHNMILVQHYVYQKALQETLGNSGIVDDFVFVFPFDRSRSAWEYCGGKFNNTGEAAVTKIIVRKPDDLNGKITSILAKYEGELTSGNCPAHDVSYRVLHTKAKSAKYDKRAAVKNCRFIDICGGCADRS